MRVLKHLIFIFFPILTLGCNEHKKQSEDIKIKSEKIDESFESFFEKFNRDSTFQTSRVVFPFKVMQLSDEGESDDADTYNSTFIARSDWKKVDFTFPNEKNIIVNKTRINENEVNFQYGIEDTGIYVEYFFQKREGKWWLVYAKDSSD